DYTLGRIEIAGDDPKERGLAAPIATNHAPPFPLGDGQRHVAEQRSGAVLNGGGGDTEKRHGIIGRSRIGLRSGDNLIADRSGSPGWRVAGGGSTQEGGDKTPAVRDTPAYGIATLKRILSIEGTRSGSGKLRLDQRSCVGPAPLRTP